MDIYSAKYDRSMLRILVYRAVGAIITAFIIYALTGTLALAIGVGAISLVAKTILYYLHEKVWTFISSRREKP